MPNVVREASKHVETLGAPGSAFDATHPPLTGVAQLTADVGVFGIHRANGPAVEGFSESGNGIVGTGALNGVVGQTKATAHSGVLGTHEGGGRGVSGMSDAPGGIGVWGSGAHLAAKFEGNVEVTGDVCCPNADCAEYFDIKPGPLPEPGTVMVLGNHGMLEPSTKAYDRRVAGIVSGAGNYKPAIILDKKPTDHSRSVIALVGKTYCKVDATYNPISIGDLLTTSPTTGSAMKAADSQKAFGAVIGKALQPFREGTGLIPILVALQ